MAFDQEIRYRASIDDSQFQAKLTQMRASLDSTVGGAGGMGGFNFGRSMAYMAPGYQGHFGPTSLAGQMADFGAAVAPVTYTPPTVAMQPHFGMFSIHQQASQAGLSSVLGPLGVSLNQMRTYGLIGGKDFLSPNISMAEYIKYSQRSVADAMASNVTAALGTAAQVSVELAGGALGTGIATSMFGSGMITGLIGGVAGAGIAGALLPVGAGMARAANTIGMQGTLAAGSWRFYQGNDTDSLTGRGFSRQDRADISRNIARMEARDGRFNMTDYRQILEMGSQMDLFSGTRDAEDFQRKFKDLVTMVKTVSSTLHTSLREGMEVIRGLRDMGVTDPVAQSMLVNRSEALGRASGRTGMEMMAFGQTGAEMFRGTGVSMQRGFELNQMNVSMVRGMLNNGTLSRETIAQAGGEASLAQRMTANALASFQTLEGRGFMMASFDPKTGNLDPNMMSRLAGGDVISGLANAAGVMSNPGNLIRFQANQHDMISKMNPMQMQTFSMVQTATLANTMRRNGLAGDASFEDTYMAMGLTRNIDREVLKTELAMLKNDPNELRKGFDKQIEALSDQQALEKKREREYGYKFYTDFFKRALIEPVGEAFGNVYNKTARGTETLLKDASQFITGGVDNRYINSQSMDAAKTYLDELMLERMARHEEQFRKNTGREMSEEERRVVAEKEAKDIRGPGFVVDVSELGIKHKFGGTAQGNLLSASENRKVGPDGKLNAGGVKVSVFKSEAALEEAAKNSGQIYRKVGTHDDGTIIAMSDDDMGTATNVLRSFESTPEEFEKTKKDMRANKQVAQRMAGLVTSGRESLADVLTAVTGKAVTEDDIISGRVSREDMLKARAAAEEYSIDGAKQEIEKKRELIEQVQDHISADSGDDLSDRAYKAKIKADTSLSELFGKETPGLWNMLVGRKYNVYAGGLKGTQRENLVKGLRLLQTGGDRPEATNLLTSAIGSEKARRFISKVDMGTVSKKELEAALTDVQQDARLQETVKVAGQTVMQNKSGAMSGLSGAVGLEAQNAILELARAQEDQIKALLNLREKLRAEFKME